ncbi:CYTH and CHAD domain-containing protein [Cellulomonas sp. IC4_254]|uniref:CYTH and CHAD domain-containing protein n=1 Tax=Cellulomonas sp. IC4_254 TaxID=2714040 RepID=UPI0014223BEE|nr:CYTH and CHAD domain-containing protein [Cellulomonas sp. IC4_254]NHT16695.1 CYTH and CHAD domain-containing protein [Cellulomonas sp. IC4_254]
MADVHREIERKYAADADVELPALTELLPGAAGLPDGGTPVATGEDAAELDATYFDTADLRLAAAGLTLRRRTGGPDAGWHLKVPAGPDERSEVRLPPGRAARTVPATLRALVHAATLGATLRPVAEVRTSRTVHRAADATGRVLLELVDDRVTARRIRPSGSTGDVVGAAEEWREVEVELVDGPADLLDAVEERLGALGVRPAGQRSKLERVLGPADERAPVPRRLTATSPAGEVVVGYLSDQLDRLREQDLRVRLGAPDAVHQMRVAARRVRNALRTFRRLFEPGVVRPLRDELGWLADVLGRARDAEVLRERVRSAVEGPGAEEAVGTGTHGAAVAADAELGRAAQDAIDALLRELDGDRYRRLLRDLASFVAEPRFSEEGRRRARRVLPAQVARRDRKVRRRLRRARRVPEGRRRDDALHDARKAAKAARYAGESVAGVLGKDAARYARRMEDLQEVLGEHHDSVVVRARLRDLARHAPSTEVAFLYGRLHALEEARGRDTAQAARAVSSAATATKLRRWLG